MYNSIYPAYASSYLGINNRRLLKKSDEEKASQTKESAQQTNADSKDNAAQKEHKNPQSASYFPNGEKTAIDYTKKRIHIDEVFSDFRNTANAIGTPEDIRKEVDAYLELAQSQTYKENPNKQLISSNLKNASQILDEYITKTLKKPSNVVEHWVDTLFLQQIDFKSRQSGVEAQAEPEAQAAEEIETAQTEEVDENIAVETEEAESVEETESGDVFEKAEPDKPQSEFYVPDDPELRRLFVRAKKYSAIDDKEKALYAFQNVTEYAQETGDYRVEAMARFEQGKLYDDFNMPEDALYNYHQAAKQSDDNNIKARAYKSMGRIYDEYVKMEPAAEHYAAAAAFAGEADNLKLQASAFSDLARLFAERYEKAQSVAFMDLANIAGEETGDNITKGKIYSGSAKVCTKLNDNHAALKFLGKSASSYAAAEDDENLIKNYIAAAEIMLQYGNSAKARKLLSKAYLVAQNCGNVELKNIVTDKLAAV